MPKYVKVRSFMSDDGETFFDQPMLPHLEVEEFSARFTGIYDANGDEYWHFPNPIGFEKELWD
jgi:hypothetical protein